MILRMITVVLLLGLLSGCGKHYWEASGRGVGVQDRPLRPAAEHDQRAR